MNYLHKATNSAITMLSNESASCQRSPPVSTCLVHVDTSQGKSYCTAKIFQHSVSNNGDFAVQAAGETCVQRVYHSDPRLVKLHYDVSSHRR